MNSFRNNKKYNYCLVIPESSFARSVARKNKSCLSSQETPLEQSYGPTINK